MRTLATLVVFIAASSAFVPAVDALTPERIDSGAKRATAMLRAVTARLAGKAPQAGRVRKNGAGLATGDGDDEYRQPFVQAGQAGIFSHGVPVENCRTST